MIKNVPPVLCALACSGVYAYRALLKGCGLHAVVCGVIYLYPRRGNYILCECLTSFASRWALLTIVPIPTGLHRPRKERGCYSCCSRLSCVSLCSVCQSSFVSEQVGNRTPAAWVKGGKAAIRYPVRSPMPIRCGRSCSYRG